MTFLIRAFGLGVFLPEIAVDFVVGRIPGELESIFIRSLGEGAKVLALLTAIAVFLVLPGIYATLYRRIEKRLKNRWYVLAFFTFSSAGIVLLAILPLLGGGFLGSGTSAGAGFAAFSQIVGYGMYAAVLDYVLVDVAAEYPQGFHLSRRQFIAGTIATIALAIFTFYGLASLAAKKGRLVFASIDDMLARETTPTADFYVVTKNVMDPNIRDATIWQLAVDGLVSNPQTYQYADLEPLASANEFVTLECVSNDVGGNLISTAAWGGVPLATLLQAAGVDASADWVVFTCADGYTAAVPMSKAMDPTTLVALKMNGDRLTPIHGFPARIIVPGLYGMFHAKWVTKIEAVHGEYLGFWQQKGWTNSNDGKGRIRTTAIIATPRDSAVVERAVVHLGGIAFAGDRGISAVKVSADGGMPWGDATLKLPPKSNLTWVLWTFDWTPPRSGSFRIVAYAVDGAGTVQDPAPASTFPDGASGYDSITLLVP